MSEDRNKYHNTLKRSFKQKYDNQLDSWSNEHEQDAVFTAMCEALRGREEPQHILDVGCGRGRDVMKLAALGHTAVGIDIIASPEWPALNAKFPGRVSFHNAFLQHFESRIPFDAIFDNGCFHHQAPDELEDYLRKCSDLLHARGFFCVSIFDLEGPRIHTREEDGRIVINFSEKEIDSLLQGAGFRMSKMTLIQRLPAYSRYRVLVCHRV